MSGKCERCGKGFQNLGEVLEVEGFKFGLECGKKVQVLMSQNKGLKGDKLLSLVRKEYKECMRQTTITGMIKKGMFPGIANFEEFVASKKKEEAAKKALKEAKKKLLEESNK